MKAYDELLDALDAVKNVEALDVAQREDIEKYTRLHLLPKLRRIESWRDAA